MDELDNHREGSLSDRFEDFEAAPSDGVWEGISNGMHADAQLGGLAATFNDYEVAPSAAVWDGIAADMHPNRKRRAAFWWWSAAASVVVLLSTYFFWPDQANEAMPLATDQNTSTTIQTPELPKRNNSSNTPFNNEQNNASNDTQANDVSNADGNNTSDGATPQNGFDANSDHTPETPSTPRQRVQNGLALDQQPSQNENATIDQQQLENGAGVESANSFEQLASMPLLNVQLFDVTNSNTDDLIYYPVPPLPEDKNNVGNWALAANMQPFVGTPEASEWSPVNETRAVENSFATTPSESLDKDAGYNYSGESYSPPIVLGGVVSKRLGNRFNLESGVSFSILRSRQDAYLSSKYMLERHVTQQYLGLPLQLQTNIINRKLNLYLSTGVLLETALNTRVRDLRFEAQEEVENVLTKVASKGGQVAAVAGIGLDLQLGKHMSLYVQPSVTRYVYQSQYNIWSQRKYWGSMQTGLRFRF